MEEESSGSPDLPTLWDTLKGLCGTARADALARLGAALFDDKCFVEAISVYEEAAEIFVAEDRVLDSAEMYFAAAASKAHSKRWEDALLGYRIAADQYRACAEEVRLATCLSRIASALTKLERNDEALECYGQARRIFHAEGHIAGRGDVAHSQGELLVSMGRHEEALAVLVVARSDARGPNSEFRIPCIDDDMGSALLGLGRADEAVKRLSSCVDFFTAIDKHDMLLFSRFRVAAARVADGQFSRAAQSLRSIRGQYIRRGEPGMIACCHLEVAKAKHGLGHTRSAMRNLRQARAVFDALGDDNRLSEVDILRESWTALLDDSELVSSE